MKVKSIPIDDRHVERVTLRNDHKAGHHDLCPECIADSDLAHNTISQQAQRIAELETMLAALGGEDEARDVMRA